MFCNGALCPGDALLTALFGVADSIHGLAIVSHSVSLSRVRNRKNLVRGILVTSVAFRPDRWRSAFLARAGIYVRNHDACANTVALLRIAAPRKRFRRVLSDERAEHATTIAHTHTHTHPVSFVEETRRLPSARIECSQGVLPVARTN